jgi:ribonucleotide reductase beta subunit family protein with ferritin-like domain
VNHLILLGFAPKRLVIDYCERLDNGIQKDRRIKIESIEQISENDATFCFNEPKNHTGIFNGILTCQSEVYSLLIDTYVESPERREYLFNAIEEIPCIKRKADWALKYMDPKTNSFAKRLVAFGIVEGLFFSGAFCSIFWLKQRGLMTKSLGKSNEWISRDEGLHTEFAVLLYQYIVNKLTEDEMYEIMRDAVNIEEDFICDSLPCRLIGMNQELMCQYIRYVADRLLIQFGYKSLYNTTNPFPFMDTISLEGKTNFFEQRVTEYVLSSSCNKELSFDMSTLDSDVF